MSAGMMPMFETEPRPIQSLDTLAPRFQDAVQAALSECRLSGIDAIVYETLRTAELQALYYARGRTIIPPHKTVTNAKDNLHSWHGYGLAADIISASMYWNAPADWWKRMGAIFEKHGCDWGGRWTVQDLPHVQWGRLKKSPSARARELYENGGFSAVWREVGATYEPS